MKELPGGEGPGQPLGAGAGPGDGCAAHPALPAVPLPLSLLCPTVTQGVLTNTGCKHSRGGAAPCPSQPSPGVFCSQLSGHPNLLQGTCGSLTWGSPIVLDPHKPLPNMGFPQMQEKPKVLSLAGLFAVVSVAPDPPAERAA